MRLTFGYIVKNSLIGFLMLCLPLPVLSQEIREDERVEIAKNFYALCRTNTAKDSKLTDSLLSRKTSLDLYCRCVGTVVAASVNQEDLAYIQKHQVTSAGKQADIIRIQSACLDASE